MGLWKSLKGTLLIEGTSADICDMLSSINAAGIEIQNFRREDELTARFLVGRKQFRELQKLCERRGENIKILKKSGLYWSGAGLKNRPVLVAGLLLFFLGIIWLPSRVFFVRVDGNESLPPERILEAAEKCGIRFGAYAREIRSEYVKNRLLEEIPELQWTGINTKGCVAVISVREKETEEASQQDPGITNIVAVRDGIILSATVTRGTGLCEPGAAVQEGQLLISGYQDCGRCVLAGRAEGEVFGQTVRLLESVTPVEYLKTSETGAEKKKAGILLGKKRINLWKDSGIWDGSCGRMYKEYRISLPGGFQLPLAVWTETYYQRETEVSRLGEEAQNSLILFSRAYLQSQMVAGTIIHAVEVCTLQDEVLVLKGSYLCEEMIGRAQKEKIGEYYGENN